MFLKQVEKNVFELRIHANLPFRLHKLKRKFEKKKFLLGKVSKIRVENGRPGEKTSRVALRNWERVTVVLRRREGSQTRYWQHPADQFSSSCRWKSEQASLVHWPPQLFRQLSPLGLKYYSKKLPHNSYYSLGVYVQCSKIKVDFSAWVRWVIG